MCMLQTIFPQVHLAASTVGSCMQDFAEGPLAQQNLDAGANMLIPVPSPLGGVIVIGESVIAYFAEGQAMKVTPIKQTIIRVRLQLRPFFRTHTAQPAAAWLIARLSAIVALQRSTSAGWMLCRR